MNIYTLCPKWQQCFTQFYAAVLEEIQMIFVARLIHLHVSDGGKLKIKMMFWGEISVKHLRA